MDLIAVDPVRNIPGEAQINEVFKDMKSHGSVETPQSEDYRVRLPVFEGPLDLLLHLIRREQLNIYDIPVAQICKSYLEYLDVMCQPDVNIAGEFFVMAATLLHLKSQILLPQDERTADEEDPRLPLVAQLLELERFKLAAAEIDKKEWLDRDLYARPASVVHDIPVESLLDAPLEPVDTFQLLVALKTSLDRTHRTPIKIAVDTTSIRDRVTAIGHYLEEQGVVQFRSLIPPEATVFHVVVSFLAMLELARLKFIEIIQTETFGPIQLRKVQSIEQLNMAMLEQF